MPVASVSPEERRERAELEPSDVKLSGVLESRNEASDVETPEAEFPKGRC